MGRKNKNAIIERNNAKKPDSAKLNKVKKDAKNFKVTSQNKIKKAKQVQNSVQNVKKLTPVKGKKGAKTSEKLNKQMDALLKDMVVKQAKPEPKKVNTQKPKGKGPKAKEVADVLAKMDM